MIGSWSDVRYALRLVQRLLSRRLERRVVVQDVGLVRVDVPLGHAGHLRGEARARERMVEVAGHPVEDIRVGERAEELRDEVRVVVVVPGVSSGPALIASIGSSIAYELRSPMIRKSGSPLPVGSLASQSTSALAAFVRVTLQLPCAVAGVGIADVRAGRALRLQVVHVTVKRAPVAFSWNVCASAGRFRVSMKRGSTAEVSTLNGPTGVTFAGL